MCAPELGTRQKQGHALGKPLSKIGIHYET